MTEYRDICDALESCGYMIVGDETGHWGVIHKGKRVHRVVGDTHVDGLLGVIEHMAKRLDSLEAD